jgi:hypothetical protein
MLGAAWRAGKEFVAGSISAGRFTLQGVWNNADMWLLDHPINWLCNVFMGRPIAINKCGRNGTHLIAACNLKFPVQASIILFISGISFRLIVITQPLLFK